MSAFEVHGKSCFLCMKVSIIIPVYNVQDYIEKCLASVSEQTYSGEIECILVDDCGTDGSIALAEKYIGQDCSHVQYRIVRHEQNRGLSAARNTGIQTASGEWLFFLDSDDWITADCLQVMMAQVEAHPKAEMIMGNYQYEGADKDWKFADPGVYSENFVQMALYNLIYPMAPNKLLSRRFLLANDLFFVEGLLHEDVLWTMQLSCYLHQMVSIPEQTYCYVVHHNSISTKRSYEFHYKHLTSVKLHLIDFAFAQGFSTNVPLYKFCTERLYDYILDPIGKNRKDLADAFCASLRKAPFWPMTFVWRNRRSIEEVAYSLHRYLPENFGIPYLRIVNTLFSLKNGRYKQPLFEIMQVADAV